MSKGGGSGGAERAIKESTAQAVGELKRQFGVTQENLQPFLEAGKGALPDFLRGTTLEGLSQNLSKIFDTDIFGDLVGERRNILESGASAQGTTRGGGFFKDLADIPLESGLGIEQLIQGRLGELVGLGSGTAQKLGQTGASNATNIASLLQGQGSNVASLRSQQSAQKSASRQGLLNAGIGAVALLAASDSMLKTNIEPVSEVGNLTMYQWDWHKEIKDTFISKFPTIGFMAQEVEEKYPEYVYELGGIKAINYGALMDRLETDYGAS